MPELGKRLEARNFTTWKGFGTSKDEASEDSEGCDEDDESDVTRRRLVGVKECVCAVENIGAPHSFVIEEESSVKSPQLHSITVASHAFPKSVLGTSSVYSKTTERGRAEVIHRYNLSDPVRRPPRRTIVEGHVKNKQEPL